MTPSAKHPPGGGTYSTTAAHEARRPADTDQTVSVWASWVEAGRGHSTPRGLPARVNRNTAWSG